MEKRWDNIPQVTCPCCGCLMVRHYAMRVNDTTCCDKCDVEIVCIDRKVTEHQLLWKWSEGK